MKITSFNPFVSTEQPDSAIALFEALGFERRHRKEGVTIADHDDTVNRMKNPDGFYMDVVQTKQDSARDVTGIRMNVDDFDAAYELLEEHGFKNAYGNETVDTTSSKSAMMVAPSGFVICIIHHIKDHS